MKKLDIWCEGITDQKFLADVISEWFGRECKLVKTRNVVVFEARDESNELIFQIREKGGISPFISPTAWNDNKVDFIENQTQNIKNVVILDADLDFNSRNEEILKTTEGVILAENIFLWPNNKRRNEHQTENLDLEMLLEDIMKVESKNLFLDCWKNYGTCLSGKINPKSEKGEFSIPDKKAMIYAFIEAFTGDLNETKPENRNYRDHVLWSLSFEKEPLKPLKEFLEKYIILL